MKKLFSLLAAVIFSLYLLTSGCGSDSNSPTGDDAGDGGGGGGTGSVTFTVALVQNQQNEKYFEFKPSTGVVVTQVTANCAAAGINNETIQADGTTVYTSTNPLYIGPVTVSQTGQQWTFKFQGKIGNAQGQAYDVTSNYTIP